MRRVGRALLVAAAVVPAAVFSVAGRAADPGAADGPGAGRATIDRFACYPAQFSAFRPQALLLLDRLALQLKVSIDLPESICAPASRAGGSATDSTSYLTCYRISSSSRFASRTVRSTDEFGGLSMSVVRPVSVCAASARVDQGGSSVPAKRPSYYACYSSKPIGVIARAGVLIGDAFGASQDAVRGPLRLCSPAARKGSLLLERRHLACYGVASATKGPTVVVRNDFGFLKAAVGPRDRLCVTATVSRLTR